MAAVKRHAILLLLCGIFALYCSQCLGCKNQPLDEDFLVYTDQDAPATERTPDTSEKKTRAKKMSKHQHRRLTWQAREKKAREVVVVLGIAKEKTLIK